MNIEEMRKTIQNNPNVDTDLLLEAQDVLAKELKKPYKKRDNGRIEELTDLIYRLTSSDDIDTVTANGIEKLYKTSEVKNAARPRKRWTRLAVVSAVCLLVLICANVWTVQALDLNIFQTVYHILDGRVEIHFGKKNESENEISLNVSKDDPYGMQAKCAEYNINPLTPSYIPAGFSLNKIDAQSTSMMTCLYFFYENGNKQLTFYYRYIPDENIFIEGKYGFPSDQYHFSEKIIGKQPVFISWEDQQFTATFTDDDQQITYTVQSLEMKYDEAMEVLSSMFN